MTDDQTTKCQQIIRKHLAAQNIMSEAVLAILDEIHQETGLVLRPSTTEEGGLTITKLTSQ